MSTEATTLETSPESTRHSLVKSLKNVAADADDLLKQVANSTAAEYSAISATMENKLSDARAMIDDARTVVTDSAKTATDATNSYVRQNPWAAIGIGVVSGIAIGMILARR